MITQKSVYADDDLVIYGSSGGQGISGMATSSGLTTCRNSSESRNNSKGIPFMILF